MTVLHQRKVMHARLQGGALYSYSIFDGEAVIGAKSVHINKKFRPWTETATYALRDDPAERTFNNAGDFIAAYEAKKLVDQRNKEWDAAAPKREKKA